LYQVELGEGQMGNFWDNFGEMFKHAQESARQDGNQPVAPTVFARLTKEEFRLTRVTEDAAARLRQSTATLTGRVERCEDALWEIVELARDQETLIEHRRAQNKSVSDVDVARWLAFRKASKRAAEALGLDIREV
jgi:hypothetical protein